MGSFSSLAKNQALEAIDASGAGVPAEQNSSLGVDEMIVLDQLTAVAATHALDTTGTAADVQRVQAKQGIAALGPNDTTVGTADAASANRHAVATSTPKNAFAHAMPLAIPVVAAPPPDITALLPAVAYMVEPDAHPMDSIAGGHAGNSGSSSDQENSQASRQSAWLEAAGMAEPVTLAAYQAPLFNRRLETNGVDDALLLVSAAARREVEGTGHVAVSPVEPVSPVAVVSPVVPERTRMAVSLRADADATARQARFAWKYSGRRRSSSVTVYPPHVSTPAMSRSIPAKRHRYPKPWRQTSPRQHPDVLKSEPHTNSAAERDACWVVADGQPRGAMHGLRRPTRLLGPNAVLHPGWMQHLVASRFKTAEMRHFHLGKTGHYYLGMTVYLRIIYLM